MLFFLGVGAGGVFGLVGQIVVFPYLYFNGYPEIAGDVTFWRTCKATTGMTAAEARTAMAAFMEPGAPGAPPIDEPFRAWATPPVDPQAASAPEPTSIGFIPDVGSQADWCIVDLEGGVVTTVELYPD